jgi:hypothetical protein
LCADGKNYYSQQQCRIIIARLSRSDDTRQGEIAEQSPVGELKKTSFPFPNSENLAAGLGIGPLSRRGENCKLLFGIKVALMVGNIFFGGAS